MSVDEKAVRSFVRGQELVEELREMTTGSRDIVEKSRAVLEHSRRGMAGKGADADQRFDRLQSKERSLERLADLLLHAHRLAEGEADPATRILIEGVLLQIGRRLAMRVGPKASGCILH